MRDASILSCIKTISFLLILLAASAQFPGGRGPASASGLCDSSGRDTIECGRFLLHKLQQQVGEENYEISRDRDMLVLRSEAKITDRGTLAPLTATIRMQRDFTPERFELTGRTSRLSMAASSIKIEKGCAVVVEGGKSERLNTPDRFFTIRGHAPAAAQMLLLRYWAKHGAPDALQILGSGDASIRRCGQDHVEINGKRLLLHRYSVQGVVWGQETLWLDSNAQLIALVTVDAEFDRFESVRAGYESLLPFFVRRATEDGLDSLRRLSSDIGSTPAVDLAIVGGYMLDVAGGSHVVDSAIVIHDGRIAAAGPRSMVKIPRAAKVLSAYGKTVMPGLWDMHAHCQQVEWGPVYLGAGVTTVRDVGNEFEFITILRDGLNSGKSLGPRLLLAGIVDGSSPSSFGIIRADKADQVRAVVGRYKAAGFQQIKIYGSINPEIVPVIAEEARRVGLSVTGHVPDRMNTYDFIQAGVTQINHIGYVLFAMLPEGYKPGQAFRPADLNSPRAKDVVQFLAKKKAVVDPTLALAEILTHPADIAISSFEPGAAKLPAMLSTSFNSSGVPTSAAAYSRSIFENFLNIVGLLHKSGVQIVAGSDQAIPGHSIHRELELYVKAGLSPLEAIRTATIIPAQVMGLENESGAIEVGKRADLIIIDGNPLNSISDIRKVKYVVTSGRVLDSARLWRSVGFKP